MGTSTVDITHMDTGFLRQAYADGEPVDISASDWLPKKGTFDALRCGAAAAVTVVVVTLGGNTMTLLRMQPGETIRIAGKQVTRIGTTAGAGELHALYF